MLFIKTASAELPDDPFEVSLRDNYELLEDEHTEAQKRTACLVNKIDELKRSHVMLPHQKVRSLVYFFQFTIINRKVHFYL